MAAETAFRNAGLESADIVVIVIFLIMCLMVGIWATWQTQRGSVSGYFLAGRDIMWFAIGASLFSSNIGSGSFVGLAGTGAASGIAVASYELNGLFCLLLLGWLFVPVYISSGVFTMPEYLMRRFGGQRLQTFMAVLSLLIYVFTKISADIYAGALFIQQAVGWDKYPSIIVLLVVTAIYTVSGGLRAVIYTDTMQTVIMLAGSLVLTAISFDKVGGIQGLYEKYPQAIASTVLSNATDSERECSTPTSEAFHLLRPADASDLPWPGNLFGITILSCWYFCNDQVLVQRSLAAKNMLHVKGGSILAAYLKVLPLFTTVFPGMISRVLFADEVGCVDPDVCEAVCNNRAGCTNVAYPKLVIELLPTGLKGLMLAAMIAALMSSLTSNFNSSATIFTIDIWKRFRNKASDAEMLVIGRMFIVLLMGLSVLWIPVLELSQGGQLFLYIQTVTGYFAPPILALFLLAILWERMNEKGAFWGLMIGVTIGLTRMALDFSYSAPACGEPDTRPAIVSQIHFLHFTILLFVISLVAMMVISGMTQPIEKKHTVRLTWWTRRSDDVREEFPKEKERRLRSEEAQAAASTSSPDDAPKLSSWRRGVYLICGYEPPQPVMELSQEDVEKQKKMMTSIDEGGIWKIIVDLNAIALMAFGIFLWAFFA